MCGVKVIYGLWNNTTSVPHAYAATSVPQNVYNEGSSVDKRGIPTHVYKKANVNFVRGDRLSDLMSVVYPVGIFSSIQCWLERAAEREVLFDFFSW